MAITLGTLTAARYFQLDHLGAWHQVFRRFTSPGLKPQSSTAFKDMGSGREEDSLWTRRRGRIHPFPVR